MANVGDTIQFEGLIDSVVMSDKNPENNGFAILRAQVDEKDRESVDHRLMDNKHRITLTGESLAQLCSGETIAITGEVTNHKVHGLQVKVTSYMMAEPRSLHNIQKFLCGHIPLINKVLAGRIVGKFGYQTFEIMGHEPQRLSEIEGIGQKRLEEIAKAWQTQSAQREELILFTNLNIPTRFHVPIRNEYGDKASRLIHEDPYCLARDIKGIGFKIADEVAKRLDIEETSDQRIRAAALYVLEESRDNDGHCFMYESDLVKATCTFLDHSMIGPDLIARVITDSVSADILKQEDNRLYAPSMIRAESTAAACLAILKSKSMPPGLQGVRLAEAIKVAMASAQVELDDTQKQAVVNALSNKVSIITGGPGTGKTTISRCVVAGLLHAGVHLELMAPTGMAAKRMSEVIGQRAGTIHLRLAQIKFCEAEPIHGAALIDELSMVDIYLLASTLKNMDPNTICVLVGDQDQLPSVGPGAVLRDLVNSGAIHTTRLTKIHRQAAGSDITVNAHGIIHGLMPRMNLMSRSRGIPGNTDMLMCEIEEPEQQLEAIKWLVTQFGPRRGFNPATHTQVIAPGHSGVVGVRNLNCTLQGLLNHDPQDSMRVYEGMHWGVGDRLMNTKNSMQLGLSNGDVGILKSIHRDAQGKVLSVVVEFDHGLLQLPHEWFKNLRLSYATTVHKTQGSEFPFLILNLHSTHWMLLQRNLLYTGVTRARQMCVLVYQSKALARALKNDVSSRRNSYLSEKLARLCQTQSGVAA